MIGRTVSHYRILEKLGEGGMGVVYKAQDLRLDRPVALKFLPVEFTADRLSRERFVREAQTASSLDHRSICAVYDIDTDAGGRMFIVMPLYQGETLKQRLGRNPLAPEEAAEIACRIAGGLARAHEKGIVHCDVKPANIFLTSDGEVKILDFGVARLKSDAAPSEGSSLGTLAYMSPEQISGRPVDARSDIWSLGVLLYESLSGQPPFAGRYPSALMYSISNQEPEPIAALRPDAPRQLAALVDRCLRKEPERRPASMEEILRILEPEPARAGTADARRWSGRKRAIAALCVAALLFGAWVAWKYFFPSATPDRATQIAILPFRNLSGDTRVAEWPDLIQLLMYNSLTGLPEIRTVEPNTINAFLTGGSSAGGTPSPAELYASIRNAGISWLIQGTITQRDSLHLLQASLTDLATQDVTHTSTVALGKEEELTAKIQILLNELTGFFQIRSILSGHDRELSPWFAHRTIHVAAMKEFLRASQFIFKGMSGAYLPLQNAVKYDSNFISARVWLISGLVQLKRKEEAQQHLRWLRRLYPAASPFEQAMIDWSDAYIAGDRHAEARALEMALTYSPKNNIILYTLSGVRYTLKDYEGALETILPAIDMRWEFPPAYHQLALCYFRLNRHDEAQETLQRIRAMKSIYWESYGLLALYARKRGDTAQADEWDVKYVRRVQEFGMSEDMAENALGLFYADCDMPGAALPHLQRAASEEPASAPYRSACGEALRALSRPAEAEREFREALRIDSTLPPARYELAGLMNARGDRAGAAAQYRIFLRYDSASPQAAEARRRLQSLSP